MSVPFRAGIDAQPQNLEEGASALRARLTETDLARLRQGTIVFSGIGASWHALLPAVRRLRAAGRRAFAIPAPELAAAEGLGDAYVLVSQSGASTELVAVAERLDSARTYAVSAQGEGALARAAGAWLPLGPHPDTTVSTLSYTATLQSLGMLCEEIISPGGASGWPALGGRAAAMIDASEGPAKRLAYALADVATIDAVGSAASLASAGETALLAREALRLPASGEETRQYLHGALEAVDERFGCILFGGQRELELARELASFGATVATISSLGEGRAQDGGAVHALSLPPIDELAAPVLQIIPIQLTVAHAAAARGLTVAELRRPQEDTKVAHGR